MIKAPWTQEQVDGLNAYQAAPWVHPFTCGNRDAEGHREHAAAVGAHDHGILVATKDGWVCPVCSYTQDWAHARMAKGAPPKPRFS